MRSAAKLVTFMVALSASSLFAADWPSIYGPAGNSTSDQKGLLRTWPKEGPAVLWTVPVGAGYGGPVVSGGKVKEALGHRWREILDLSSRAVFRRFYAVGAVVRTVAIVRSSLAASQA